MSDLETRVNGLEKQVSKLKSKFNRVMGLAALLGFSVVGITGWVKSEASKVDDLHKDIAQNLEPSVRIAKGKITDAGNEQVGRIGTSADLIVRQLTQANFERMSTNSVATSDGVTAKNLYGSNDKDMGSTEISCPAGQYLAGVKVHWAGTCKSACDQDGGAVHSLVPICRKLVP